MDYQEIVRQKYPNAHVKKPLFEAGGVQYVPMFMYDPDDPENRDMVGGYSIAEIKDGKLIGECSEFDFVFDERFTENPVFQAAYDEYRATFE